MLHVDDGQLHAYLDGELAPFGAADERDITTHLAACTDCQARLEEARQMRERANAILRHSGPAERAAPPFASITSRGPGASARVARRWTIRPGATAAWAASIILALGLGWFGREMTRSGMAPQAAAYSESASAVSSAEMPAMQDTGPASTAPLSAHSGIRARPAPADPAHTRSMAAPASAEPSMETSEVTDDASQSRIAAAAAPATAAKDGPPREIGAGAETLATARGRVTTEAGAPVANAQVQIGSLSAGAITAPDGTYSLTIPSSRLPEPAELTITAQVIGMTPETHRVTLKPGETAMQDFQLEPAELALDAVVVTSQGNSAARENSAAAAPAPPVPAGHSTWVSVDRAEAEKRLGGPIFTVADLPVTDIAVGTADGELTVRTRQRTGGNQMLELFQRRAPRPTATRPRTRSGNAESAAASEDHAAADDRGMATLVLERSGYLISARAPLSPDSLRELLSKLR